MKESLDLERTESVEKTIFYTNKGRTFLCSKFVLEEVKSLPEKLRLTTSDEYVPGFKRASVWINRYGTAQWQPVPLDFEYSKLDRSLYLNMYSGMSYFLRKRIIMREWPITVYYLLEVI